MAIASPLPLERAAPAARGDRPAILEMVGISKQFGSVVALDHADLTVWPGEMHSVIGQNGAGKSTLMNILSGVYRADEGEIRIDGQPVTIPHPREALRLGIGTVYQELSLLPKLTVADNIFLGREPGNGFVIDERAVLERARAVLANLGVTRIDVQARVEDLPLAQQQLVEIAKVLSHEPRILVLDEPTSSLSEDETAHLFELLKGLKARGIAIIFISHRFKEIIQHCDRGTILRNGQVVRTLALAGVSEEQLAEAMIGQQLESFYRYDEHAAPTAVSQAEHEAQPVLQVENLSIGRKIKDVSFQLYRGEIVGITGLLGAGQNEIARALFGIQPNVKGAIRRQGRVVQIHSPADALDLGLCLLTEHRKLEGLFLDLTVQENMTLPSLGRFRRAGLFVDGAREGNAARELIRNLNIIVSSPAARMRTLSGGNQQKTILGRWLLRDLQILIFIEPTRGIDVGAKAEIYQYLDRLTKQGKTIVVVSPELPEILGIADRTFVMYNGRLTHVFERAGLTEDKLLAAVQGGNGNGTTS